MLKSMLQHVSYIIHTDGYFFPLIISGSFSSCLLNQKYKLPVLDTIFVRKKHRGKDLGLIMLEDFVNSFTEEPLGLRYPLSSFLYTGKLFNFFFWSSLWFLYMSKWVLSSSMFVASSSGSALNFLHFHEG